MCFDNTRGDKHLVSRISPRDTLLFTPPPPRRGDAQSSPWFVTSALKSFSSLCSFSLPSWLCFVLFSVPSSLQPHFTQWPSSLLICLALVLESMCHCDRSLLYIALQTASGHSWNLFWEGVCKNNCFLCPVEPENPNPDLDAAVPASNFKMQG